MIDLAAIAYRIYPGVSKVSAVFAAQEDAPTMTSKLRREPSKR
jgi:hypothetical protein